MEGCLIQRWAELSWDCVRSQSWNENSIFLHESSQMFCKVGERWFTSCTKSTDEGPSGELDCWWLWKPESVSYFHIFSETPCLHVHLHPAPLSPWAWNDQRAVFWWYRWRPLIPGEHQWLHTELEVRVSALHFLQPGHNLLLYDYLKMTPAYHNPLSPLSRSF